MKEFTIEQAFQVRQQILEGTYKGSPSRSVITNIINGVYDNCDENPIIEAENDLLFLSQPLTVIDGRTIPKVGQVWKVKPQSRRAWRPDVLTISHVKTEKATCAGTSNEYFTYQEQAEADSCWVFDMLENYTLEENKL